MSFVEEVFKLSDQLSDCVEKRDLEGVKTIKRRQFILWSNASDEDLKAYASYQARRLSISDEEALSLLKSIRILHQKRLKDSRE